MPSSSPSSVSAVCGVRRYAVRVGSMNQALPGGSGQHTIQLLAPEHGIQGFRVKQHGVPMGKDIR